MDTSNVPDREFSQRYSLDLRVEDISEILNKEIKKELIRDEEFNK